MPHAWSRPQVAMLSAGRLHLQHGPIDLVIGAEGAADELEHAYAAAAARFETVLGDLTDELPLLRSPLAGASPPSARSPIAKRMIAACWPHRSVFITPMAAVAGAVADEIKAAILAVAPELATFYVNNGGDIAVHVAEGRTLRIGLVADLAGAVPEGLATLDGLSCVGGVATSGWRGRSFSLGIADAVTILARCAAEADSAATIVANAVNAEHAAISRAPANALDPDSDLGVALVTTGVGPLPDQALGAALASGAREAERLVESGDIHAAALSLQGRWRIVDGSGLLLPLP